MTDDLSAETAQGVHVGDVVKRGGSVLQVKDQLKRLPRLQALFFLYRPIDQSAQGPVYKLWLYLYLS